MNLLKSKYIIMELIPSHSNPKCGNIVQIQALLINGIKLIDRFDYRLNLDKIENEDLRNMLNYDNDMFTYLDDSKLITDEFIKWIKKTPLLIIDNYYTLDYIKELNIKNKYESVFKYLNMEISNDVFDKIMDKYKLEASNHLVDLLYEAIINESNNMK